MAYVFQLPVSYASTKSILLLTELYSPKLHHHGTQKPNSCLHEHWLAQEWTHKVICLRRRDLYYTNALQMHLHLYVDQFVLDVDWIDLTLTNRPLHNLCQPISKLNCMSALEYVNYTSLTQSIMTQDQNNDNDISPHLKASGNIIRNLLRRTK